MDSKSDPQTQPNSQISPAKPVRPPANQILLNFLKEKGIGFFFRKQKVRYIDDNSIIIEAPQVVVFYQDETQKDLKNG